MTDHVYLNADRTQIVPEYAVGKKWQVSRKEAVKLGLLESEEKPVQRRRVPETPPKPQRRRKSKSE